MFNTKKYLDGLLKRNNYKNEVERKWDHLAKKDSKYYIWSSEGHLSDKKYRDSGRRHVKKLILNDNFLKKLLDDDFSHLNVLELGCGNGRMSEFIAKRCKKLYALDISGQMIAEAKKRLPSSDNIVFLKTNGEKFPEFLYGRIDFAFSFLVFQHMPTYQMVEKNFKEISKSLKKKGFFKAQLRGRRISKKEPLWGVDYSLKKAKRLADKTGFQILRYEGENQRYFWLWLKKQ